LPDAVPANLCDLAETVEEAERLEDGGVDGDADSRVTGFHPLQARRPTAARSHRTRWLDGGLLPSARGEFARRQASMLPLDTQRAFALLGRPAKRRTSGLDKGENLGLNAPRRFGLTGERG